MRLFDLDKEMKQRNYTLGEALHRMAQSTWLLKEDAYFLWEPESGAFKVTIEWLPENE